MLIVHPVFYLATLFSRTLYSGTGTRVSEGVKFKRVLKSLNCQDQEYFNAIF